MGKDTIGKNEKYKKEKNKRRLENGKRRKRRGERFDQVVLFIKDRRW